ncbi:MAG: hypothetical protein WBX15_02255 [Thermoanaerobaculia bacterium]
MTAAVEPASLTRVTSTQSFAPEVVIFIDGLGKKITVHPEHAVLNHPEQRIHFCSNVKDFKIEFRRRSKAGSGTHQLIGQNFIGHDYHCTLGLTNNPVSGDQGPFKFWVIVGQKVLDPPDIEVDY